MSASTMNGLETSLNNEIANKKMSHRKSKSVDCATLDKAFEKFNIQANLSEKRGIDKINAIIIENEKFFALQKQSINNDTKALSKDAPRRKTQIAEVNYNDLLESLDAIASEVKIKKGKREEKQKEKKEEIEEDIDDKPNPPIKQHNYSDNLKSLINFGKKISNDTNSNEENSASGITDLLNNSKSYLLNLAKKANDTFEEMKTKDNNKVSDDLNENIDEIDADKKINSCSRKSSDATIFKSDNDQCETILSSPNTKNVTSADNEDKKEDDEMKRNDTIKKFQFLALPELPFNKNNEAFTNKQIEEQNNDKNSSSSEDIRYSKSPSMRYSKTSKNQPSPSIRYSKMNKDQSSPAVRYVKMNKDQPSPAIRYRKLSNDQSKMMNDQSSSSIHSVISNDQSSPLINNSRLSNQSSQSIHSMISNGHPSPSYRNSKMPPSPSLHYYNKIKEQVSPSTKYSKMNNDQPSPSTQYVKLNNNQPSPSLHYSNSNQSSSSIYLPNPVRKDSMRYSYSHTLNNYSNDETTNNKRRSFLNQKHNTSNGLRKKISQNRLSQNRSSINFTDYQNVQELTKLLNGGAKNSNNNELEKIVEDEVKTNNSPEKPFDSPDKQLDSPGHEEDLLGLMTSDIEKDKTLERMMNKLEAMKNSISEESQPQPQPPKEPAHFSPSPNWAKINPKNNSYNDDTNSRSSYSSRYSHSSSLEEKKNNNNMNDEFVSKRKQYHSVVIPSNRNSSLSGFSAMNTRNHHTSIQPSAMKSKYFRYSVARNLNTYNNPGSVPVPSHRTKLTVPHFDPQQQLNRGSYYNNMTNDALYEESNNINRTSNPPRGFYFRDTNEKMKSSRVSNIVSEIKDEDKPNEPEYDFLKKEYNLQQFKFNKFEDVSKPVQTTYDKEQEQWKINMHTVSLYDDENPKPKKKKNLKKRFSFFRKNNKN